MLPDDDDLQLRSYQDDLTTDDDVSDPLMDEEGENPADELGIPEDELADELDKEVDDEDEDLDSDDIDIEDDRREYVEDFDDEDDE